MGKRTITAKISEELHEKIIQSEYATITECVVAGLIVLFDNSQEEPQQNPDLYKSVLQEKEERIQELKGQLDLMNRRYDYYLSQTMIESPGAQKKWWQIWK